MGEKEGFFDSVEPAERVSRYITQSSHIRRSDNTVKPEAFVPHPYEDLSVTRQGELTEKEIWEIGEGVVQPSGKTLHGRADIAAAEFVASSLKIVPDPVDGNPNHAIVNGWPSAKPQQKIVAMQIAAKSTLVEKS